MRSLFVAVALIFAVTSSALAADPPPPVTAPFDAQKAKIAQEAWAKHLGKASPAEKNSIGIDLVLIPPGRFLMGSPATEKDRRNREGQVEVTLTHGFWLGKTEVTQSQWRAVMETTPWKGKIDVREGDNYPATYIGWSDAREFCKKLGENERATYRLPSEAEWEYACRSGTPTRFSFGDDDGKLSDHAWWGGVVGKGTAKDERYAHEVRRKNANPFGLHDMHGNVFEWCEDLYVDKLPGGTDPVVLTGGDSDRVLRGGSWFIGASDCRSACRFTEAPSSRFGYYGFRIVRSSGQAADN